MGQRKNLNMMTTGIYVDDGDILLYLLHFDTTLICLVNCLNRVFVSAANLEK